MTKGLPPFPPTLGRVITLIVLTSILPACSAPVAPDALSPLPQTASSGAVPISNPLALTPSREVVTFPLLNGVFTITFDTADGSAGEISGTYTGEAVVAIPGKATATLDMQISKRKRAGRTIDTVQADGTGAFAGEGDFTLSLTLAASTSTSSVTLKGTSNISCSASNRILVTQHATASTPRFPEFTVELHHEVGNSECFE